MRESMKRILPYLGLFLAALGLSMFFPMLLELIDGGGYARAFGLPGAAGVAVGLALRRFFKTDEDLTQRDAYLLVTTTWLAAGIYGAVPYMWSGVIPGFPQAFFETVSGFTTTGATVIRDMETIGRSMLLWRSITFWLGGLGIIVLFISMLSFFGNSGTHLFRAETTGPIKDKIAPRIRETARILWLTYILLTAVMILILIPMGMKPFEAVCYAFGVVSTSGFSAHNDSIAGLSPLIRFTLAFFTMIAGVRISLFYSAFKGRSLKLLWKNEELLVYLGLIFGAVLTTGFAAWMGGRSFFASFFDSYVQLTSSITSTGFVSIEYALWPPVGQLFMLALPFIGACAGSTGAGLKVGRLLILLKSVRSAFTHILHPKAVVNIRINNRVVSPETVVLTQVFFFVYVLVAVTSTALFCLAGFSMSASFSLVGACLNNVGPAFDQSGLLISYGLLPAWSMFFLPLLMLCGRLELYTILVVFTGGFWRR